MPTEIRKTPIYKISYFDLIFLQIIETGIESESKKDFFFLRLEFFFYVTNCIIFYMSPQNKLLWLNDTKLEAPFSVL